MVLLQTVQCASTPGRMGGLTGAAPRSPNKLEELVPAAGVSHNAKQGEEDCLGAHRDALLQACEEWVKGEIAACDASHDWCHVHRVRRQAVAIAKAEELEAKIPGGMLVVELSALLHDVKDYKYSGSDTAGVEAAAGFLKSQNVPPAFIARVLEVISNVSYKKELSSLPKLSAGECLPLGGVTELGCVQDADRLDAIGAVGIARCFTFGGAMKRPLYDAHVQPRIDLDAAMYQDGTSTTLNHFHEKLLKLKSLMKTATGRRLAEDRHKYMVGFLEQFQLEAGI